jgi:hypothetical protein
VLTALEIVSPAATSAQVAHAPWAELPELTVRLLRAGPTREAPSRLAGHDGVVLVPARVWRAVDFDPLELDEVVAATLGSGISFSLRVLHDGGSRDELSSTALQVVTRCQRHLPPGNAGARTPLFQAIVARHRALHDLSKPLVAADHAHALDTWRWVLRLDQAASPALQAAALFHDVERLVSESDVRVEQHAPHYAAFKDAHAAAGAALASRSLVELGAPPALVGRVAELVASHERPGGDPEKIVLNEADALSFFSLNAPGFVRYYGMAHTAKKVAYTLARLGPRGRRALSAIRHRADIAELIRRQAG